MRRPRTLAIVGNGMTTARLLDELAGELRRFDVTVFGEEPGGSYNRIQLATVLGGRSVREIETKPERWYADHGVRLHAGVRVVALDAPERRVISSDGQERSFDAIVLATGSAAIVPPLEGLSPHGRVPGVHVFRTVDDCARMRGDLAPGARAVVVGGGLLGLEAAHALAEAGAHVTVVHRSPVLMNAQLDAVAGGLVRRRFEARGVTIVVGNSRAVQSDPLTGAVRALELDDGTTIPADLLVFAVGVRPRVELARQAGLACERGIVVDDRLATCVPGIFAVGECAEHDGQSYGLVAPCWDQARVLARVLIEGPTTRARYRGSRVYTKLKVAGIDVASMGAIEPRDDRDEVVEVLERRRGVYRKLVVREGRLAGAIVVGDPDAAAAAVRAFDRGDALPENALDLFCSPAAFTRNDAGREICNCNRVPEAAVCAAIAGGCDSVAAIGERTGAGTGCGSCRGALARLLTSVRPREEIAA